MQFACRCGHVIKDQTDGLPYKGWVTRDKHEALMAAASKRIEDFLQATLAGTRHAWVAAHFGEDYARAVTPDEAVIFDLLSTAMDPVRLPLYSCDQCGRLWLRSHNRLLSYLPEDGERGVLDVGPDVPK
ncbi:hypothetical protein [Deinococcus ficus]|uniref:hypothetical protein n=1 Tax=Deinococcus ficus TaxID=317577 RepID=UPI0003B52380|nr:hypothetical protein [Deinococcus ficus]